ncbi:MAG: tRNA (adenosine(37)-N6)-threonylcarbamoyltransferase complex dimerization subunit type 1 TsaB [Pseudomonadota bacterium]
MRRTLVIDTATAACSVALIAGDRVIDHRHDVVGRGHAERLIPMIAALAEGGRADTILVDCGPGSFTGIRVGIAAARGLGIGWGVPVQGYSSTALIAAMATARHGAEAIAVVLEGGHGEVFVQPYDRLIAAGPLASLTPAAALAMLGGRAAFGNGVRYLNQGTELVPDARCASLLPAAATLLPAAPIYGRAPDAQPMAVRA